jgi:site-specific DNA-cytosine methylase
MEHDAPVVTITASQPRHPFRAWLSQGRVVKMTPRALARFQSVPDSYVLPDKSSLACTVIGNMVPSLMMQKIVEPLL